MEISVAIPSNHQSQIRSVIIKRYASFRFIRYACMFLIGVTYLSADTSEEEAETHDLSPFEVEESSESGYKVKNTTASMRIRTAIKDFGASLVVITERFMEDLGATDGESLLSMVGNLEVAGILGNFSNANATNSSTNDARNNPQEAQRVRGLSNAELTRDFFRTSLPFDSYNTSQVTINRGQNSMLYGFGSPGGVINGSTSRAQMGSHFGVINIRLDHQGGHRETFDVNRTLVQDRLALRISLLNEHIQYQQKPAFEKDKRFYLAWDAVLLKNDDSSLLGKTTLRGSYESAEILRNPPDWVPPIDGFSSWFEGVGGQDVLNNILRVPGSSLDKIPNGLVKREWVLGAIEAGLVEPPEGVSPEQFAAVEGTFIPKSTYNRITGEGREHFYGFIPYSLQPAVNFNSQRTGTVPGWQSPELNNIQGIMARWRPSGFTTQDLRWTQAARLGTGFSRASLNNRNVFDYHNTLWQGTTNSVLTEFDARQLFLEQDLFGGNGGIQVAYDQQNRDQSRFNPLSSGTNKTIFLDVTTHQAPADSNFDGVADRTPNENLGRPVAIWRDTTRTTDRSETDTLRITGFGTLDLTDHIGGRWGDILGSHTLTGLYEDLTSEASSRSMKGAWWANDGISPAETFISSGDNRSSFRQAYSQIYLGPDARGLNSPDELRIEGYTDVRLPQPGDEYGIWYFDSRPSLQGGQQNRWQIIDYLHSASLFERTLVSKAASLQSHFLYNTVVTTIGTRKDTQKTWGRLTADKNYGPPGSSALYLDEPGTNITDGNFNDALLELEEEPFSETEGQSDTWSIVGHYPEQWLGELPYEIDLSVHYYESESFEPDFGEVNLLYEPIDAPTGTSKEWGLTLGLFDENLTLRLSRFETSKTNDSTSLGGTVTGILGAVEDFLLNVAAGQAFELDLFPNEDDQQLTPDTFPTNRQRTTGSDADLIGVDSFEAYYDRLIEIFPPQVQAIQGYGYELRDDQVGFFKEEEPGPISGTLDYVATGTEVELIGQITDSWILSLNIAQQETVKSNIGPVAIPIAFEMLERIQSLGLYNIRDDPYFLEDTTVGSTFEEVIRRVRIQKGQEGIASQEQREWRANLLTRYDFTSGPLKGFSIGSALRYQDKVAAGYTDIWNEFNIAVPDVGNPFMGPDELNGDLFIRYRRQLGESLDWSIQLNARNLYRKNGDDDIPVRINPDGRVAVIRIPNEQQFFLTNTFRF